MLLAAALIELELAESDSLKDRRNVARSIKDKVGKRFNVSVAEVGDQDDRHSVVVGCAMVGVDPRHLRTAMAKVISFVEGLGLAEVVADDVVVVRLDELEEADELADLEEEGEA